ncbi:hypothetical protein WMY93_011479 [Mugilogobius chulae]|uniref:Uncharacterized protein n=1 Tax=Mugilogobius chulae TaxID=88201 RepID=A0AAW0P2P5_9GOBI
MPCAASRVWQRGHFYPKLWQGLLKGSEWAEGLQLARSRAPRISTVRRVWRERAWKDDLQIEDTRKQEQRLLCGDSVLYSWSDLWVSGNDRESIITGQGPLGTVGGTLVIGAMVDVVGQE